MAIKDFSTKRISLYSKSQLYREQLFNPNLYRRLWLHDNSLVVLLFSIVFFVSFGTIYTCLVYFLWLMIRSIKSINYPGVKKSLQAVFGRFFYLLYRDIIVFTDLGRQTHKKGLMWMDYESLYTSMN